MGCTSPPGPSSRSLSAQTQPSPVCGQRQILTCFLETPTAMLTLLLSATQMIRQQQPGAGAEHRPPACRGPAPTCRQTSTLLEGQPLLFTLGGGGGGASLCSLLNANTCRQSSRPHGGWLALGPLHKQVNQGSQRQVSSPRPPHWEAVGLGPKCSGGPALGGSYALGRVPHLAARLLNAPSQHLRQTPVSTSPLSQADGKGDPGAQPKPLQTRSSSVP